MISLSAVKYGEKLGIYNGSISSGKPSNVSNITSSPLFFLSCLISKGVLWSSCNIYSITAKSRLYFEYFLSGSDPYSFLLIFSVRIYEISSNRAKMFSIWGFSPPFWLIFSLLGKSPLKYFLDSLWTDFSNWFEYDWELLSLLKKSFLELCKSSSRL